MRPGNPGSRFYQAPIPALTETSNDGHPDRHRLREPREPSFKSLKNREFERFAVLISAHLVQLSRRSRRDCLSPLTTIALLRQVREHGLSVRHLSVAQRTACGRGPQRG